MSEMDDKLKQLKKDFLHNVIVAEPASAAPPATPVEKMRPHYYVEIEWGIAAYIGEWDESIRAQTYMEPVSQNCLYTFDKAEAERKFAELAVRDRELEKLRQEYAELHRDSQAMLAESDARRDKAEAELEKLRAALRGESVDNAQPNSYL